MCRLASKDLPEFRGSFVYRVGVISVLAQHGFNVIALGAKSPRITDVKPNQYSLTQE
jgi:hypothetical protein